MCNVFFVLFFKTNIKNKWQHMKTNKIHSKKHLYFCFFKIKTTFHFFIFKYVFLTFCSQTKKRKKKISF